MVAASAKRATPSTEYRSPMSLTVRDPPSDPDVPHGRRRRANMPRPPDHEGVRRAFLAYSTARVSRMTVTLIWPG